MTLPLASNQHTRHVHFPEGLLSGSHRPPQAFRKGSSRLGSVARFSLAPHVVPFDRWAIHETKERGLELVSGAWKARGRAILVLGEGLLYSLFKLISFIFTKIFPPSKAESSFEELMGHLRGLSFSLYAVVSPSRALTAWGQVRKIELQTDT